MTGELGVILAVVAVGVAMVGVVVAMMFWVRQEANSSRAEAKEDRRDMLNIIRAIQEEMKDFHVRLCLIEERNRGKP